MHRTRGRAARPAPRDQWRGWTPEPSPVDARWRVDQWQRNNQCARLGWRSVSTAAGRSIAVGAASSDESMTLRTMRRKCVASMGLEQYAVNPAASAFNRSCGYAYAVTATAG